MCRSGVKPQPNYRAARWPSRSPTTVVMLAHSSILSPLSLSILLLRYPSLTGSSLLLSTPHYTSCYLLHHPFKFFFFFNSSLVPFSNGFSPTWIVPIPSTRPFLQSKKKKEETANKETKKRCYPFLESILGKHFGSLRSPLVSSFGQRSQCAMRDVSCCVKAAKFSPTPD